MQGEKFNFYVETCHLFHFVQYTSRHVEQHFFPINIPPELQISHFEVLTYIFIEKYSENVRECFI